MSETEPPTASPSEYRVCFTDGREFGPAPMDTIVQWTRDGRVPKNARLIDVASEQAIPVMDIPQIAKIFDVPPTHLGATAGTSQSDESIATIIPYRNPPALIGYYASIFSLVPIFGLLLGPAAIICGIIGLRKRKAEPQRKGAAHAWIAISLGTLGTLISAICISVVFMDVF